MSHKIAVLVSVSGTILQAMIQRGLPIALVLADRPCLGIHIAEEADIATHVICRSFKNDFNRKAYTLTVAELLLDDNICLVVMAGYMTVFAPVMFKHFPNRVTNIHPALLPAFKGDHAVADALAFGVKGTGTTIHYATAELDSGPIIAQEAVPVLEGDPVQTLHERIKVVERRLYPEVVYRLINSY